MGVFSSSKRISRVKLEKLLRRISVLDLSERKYVKGLFSQYESGGISRLEVVDAVRKLKFDKSDGIDRNEAEAIKIELLGYLEG